MSTQPAYSYNAKRKQNGRCKIYIPAQFHKIIASKISKTLTYSADAVLILVYLSYVASCSYCVVINYG